MALTNYQTDTANLLQSPAAPSALYATANLTRWINIARGQLAGESESIWYRGTIPTVVDQRAYNFSSISTGVSATNGISGVIHVRSITYNLGSGEQWITPRNWEWFTLYSMNNPVPEAGPPTSWSQFGQGAATGGGSNATGSFYIDPPPDLVYTLNVDCVCFPIALTDDSTKEALPYLWTDAVPFFAAYYALLSSQTGARSADAERMLQRYALFVERARKASNPSVDRWLYQQSPDPTQINKLSIQRSTDNQQ